MDSIPIDSLSINLNIVNYKYDTVEHPTGKISFLYKIESKSRHILLQEKEIFSGTCFTCAKLVSEQEKHLQRCAGCQLVAYCSKNCQRADWKQHKILCKKFPIENGKNVIVRKAELVGKDHKRFSSELAELQVLATSTLQESGYKQSIVDNLFTNVKVCKICLEARPEKLFNCRCCTVSYCSRAHQMQDDQHRTQCDLLYDCAMANWYLTHHLQLQIPDGLLEEANLNDLLKFETVSKLPKYSSEKWLKTIVNLINERLSFPLTIHHALKGIRLGKQRKTLSEITSLTIHIVHMTPMLDPRIWEFFLHQLPNLKELNLTFISGSIRIHNKYNSYLPTERCSDCKRKQRIITYSVMYWNYREYFNKKTYEQPDIVFVFGIDNEIINRENVDLLSTSGKHTVVILSSFLEDRLFEIVVKRFHFTRPVKVLLPVQKNPVCGFSRLHSHFSICNENTHICCIQRNH